MTVAAAATATVLAGAMTTGLATVLAGAVTTGLAAVLIGSFGWTLGAGLGVGFSAGLVTLAGLALTGPVAFFEVCLVAMAGSTLGCKPSA